MSAGYPLFYPVNKITPAQDNVVISSTGIPKICDFGCARMIASTRTLAQLTATTRGTIQYFAPELLPVDLQAQGSMDAARAPKQSKKTDVWAFGMTIYVRLPPSHLIL